MNRIQSLRTVLSTEVHDEKNRREEIRISAPLQTLTKKSSKLLVIVFVQKVHEIRSVHNPIKVKMHGQSIVAIANNQTIFSSKS